MEDDSVSQVQRQLANVSAVFFNLIGTLQRDAAPAAQEEAAQAKGRSERGDLLAAETIEALHKLEHSILQLPAELPPQAQVLEAAVEAEARQRAAGDALRDRTEAAQAKVRQLQQLHSALAGVPLGLNHPPSG